MRQARLCSPTSVSPYNIEVAPNFELYDERFTNNDFEVDVYIPTGSVIIISIRFLSWTLAEVTTAIFTL